MTDQALNGAVARKLGWSLVKSDGRFWYKERWLPADGDSTKPLLDYCHSIAAAWEIVEYVEKAHRRNIVRLELWSESWTCQFIVAPEEADGMIGRADTAPMAIVKAFLKLP